MIVTVLDWLRRLLPLGLTAWVLVLSWREHWLAAVLLGPFLYVVLSAAIGALMIPLYQLTTRTTLTESRDSRQSHGFVKGRITLAKKATRMTVFVTPLCWALVLLLSVIEGTFRLRTIWDAAFAMLLIAPLTWALFFGTFWAFREYTRGL